MMMDIGKQKKYPQAIVGLDGYIDSLYKVVKERNGIFVSHFDTKSSFAAVAILPFSATVLKYFSQRNSIC